ncbi:hypothetical protein D3C80_710890 [compost metagenome]
MRHHRLRYFLVVIRRQPVFLLVDEGIEEVPGLAAGVAQKAPLFIVDGGFAALRLLAEVVQQERRQDPQSGEW